MFKAKDTTRIDLEDFDEFDDPSEALLEEEEEEEEDGEEEEEDDEGEEDDRTAKRFSQEDFDKAAAKSRRQAQRTAEAAVLSLLGVDSLDKAVELVTNAKTGKKEGGKADEAELAALKATNAELQASLQKRDTDSKIKDALIDAGLSAKAAAKALKLVEVEGANPSDDDVQDAIDELKEAMPALFVTQSNTEDDDEDEEDARSQSHRSTQPPTPKRKRKGASAADKAQEIFRQRHPQMTNQS